MMMNLVKSTCSGGQGEDDSTIIDELHLLIFTLMKVSINSFPIHVLITIISSSSNSNKQWSALTTPPTGALAPVQQRHCHHRHTHTHNQHQPIRAIATVSRRRPPHTPREAGEEEL